MTNEIKLIERSISNGIQILDSKDMLRIMNYNKQIVATYKKDGLGKDTSLCRAHVITVSYDGRSMANHLEDLNIILVQLEKLKDFYEIQS